MVLLLLSVALARASTPHSHRQRALMSRRHKRCTDVSLSVEVALGTDTAETTDTTDNVAGVPTLRISRLRKQCTYLLLLVEVARARTQPPLLTSLTPVTPPPVIKADW